MPQCNNVHFPLHNRVFDIRDRRTMMDEVTINPGAEKVGWCGRNLTSRILEGVMARRGLVEPRERIGLRMLDAEKH